MALTLTSSQKVELGFTATDAKGNPAPVEDVRWSSSDQMVVVARPHSDDNTLCTALAAQNLGTAQIKLEVDAKIGEGVTLLTGLLDITVVAGEAVNISITPGTPEEQGLEAMPVKGKGK